MANPFQLTVSQHCATQGCCDFEESVLWQLPIAGDWRTFDVSVGCLKAEANALIAKAVGYYFSLASLLLPGRQLVFDLESRKYLREATPEDLSRWEQTRRDYLAAKSSLGLLEVSIADPSYVDSDASNEAYDGAHVWLNSHPELRTELFHTRLQTATASYAKLRDAKQKEKKKP